MIDPSNCVRYTISESIDSVCQRLITCLSDNHPEILLIHQESHNDHKRVSTQLTLIHRLWGATFIMELVPKDSTLMLILIHAPPDPAQEDVSFYESKILENLPESSASIRLALLEGNDERALSLMKNVLREQRHLCWMHIHSGLIQSLRLEPYEGDPKELSRYIPKDIGVIDRAENLPSRDEGLVLDMWAKGFTAKQIALRTGRTEKTILNRMTLMRKTYGEQLVPRRKIT
jgi:hypothetical protein